MKVITTRILCSSSSISFLILLNGVSFINNRRIDKESVPTQDWISKSLIPREESIIARPYTWLELLIHNCRIRPTFKSNVPQRNAFDAIRNNRCPVQIKELTEYESCVDFAESDGKYINSSLAYNLNDLCFLSNRFPKWKSVASKNGLTNKPRYKRSGVLELEATQNECVGSLIISHNSFDGTLMEDVSVLRLRSIKGGGFPMLKRLSRRKIIRMDVDGNCEWKIFSGRGFRGEARVISSSINNLPFNPKSALKMST